MMDDSIQLCLIEEDNLPSGMVKQYGIREHDNFRLLAEAIELEFMSRNILFERIN